MTEQRPASGKNGGAEFTPLADTGERMIPTAQGELSFVFARHEFTYRLLIPVVSGKKVLDIGCGTGYGAALLASTARGVTAIDQSEEAIAYCRAHYTAPNVEFRVMRGEELAHEREFEVAVAFQVIEHLADPPGFLERVRRALVPGGLVFITTPNVRRPHPPGSENPFHVSEMTAPEFESLLGSAFPSFRLCGVAHSEAPFWRRALRRLPFHRLGKGISRTSSLKRVANRALDLTAFRVITHDIATNAIDLLGVCVNGREAIPENFFSGR